MQKGRSGRLYGQRDMVLLGQLTHVEHGIADTTKGGVDAYAQAVGNLFVGHLLVETHDDDFLLVFGQVLDHAADIDQNLSIGNLVLAVGVQALSCCLAAAEKVVVNVALLDGRRVLLLTEIVDDDIVGYSEEEPNKSA